jgi:hypothetical protein
MAELAQLRRGAEEERIAQPLLAMHDHRRGRGRQLAAVRHGHRQVGIARIHVRVGASRMRVPRFGEAPLRKQRAREVDARLGHLRPGHEDAARGLLGAREIAQREAHQAQVGQRVDMPGFELQGAFDLRAHGR